MKDNKPEMLKNTLFDLLEGIKNGEIELEEARTISQTANSICQVVRTEIKVAEFNEKRNVNKAKKEITF